VMLGCVCFDEAVLSVMLN